MNDKSILYSCDFLKRYLFLNITFALVEVKTIYNFFSSENAQLIYNFKESSLEFLDFSFLNNGKIQADLQWLVCINLFFGILYFAIVYMDRKSTSLILTKDGIEGPKGPGTTLRRVFFSWKEIREIKLNMFKGTFYITSNKSIVINSIGKFSSKDIAQCFEYVERENNKQLKKFDLELIR